MATKQRKIALMGFRSVGKSKQQQQRRRHPFGIVLLEFQFYVLFFYQENHH